MRAYRFSWIFIGVALALAAADARAQAPVAAPPASPVQALPAERPTYAVGDRWIRSDGAYDLVRIDNDQYVFAAGSGREIHLTKDLAIASVRRGNSVWAFEPPAKLEWPLRVGKRGQVQGQWKGPHAPDGIPAQIRWHVETIEPVTVAGVTLQAYRVSFGAAFEGPGAAPPRGSVRPGGGKGRGGGGGGGGGQGGGPTVVGFRAWYAPDVGQWVKAFSGADWATFEVVAFDRPPVMLAAKPGSPPPAAPGAPVGPLTIEVRFPKDNAHVTDEASVIVAVVNSGKGVTKVTVTVNGVEVSQDNLKGLQRSMQVGTPVTLRPGPNTIVVSATDPDGTARQETRTVIYDLPQVAAVPSGEMQPQAPPPVVRNQWAVVIGVGDYENPSVPKLRYTVPDAQAVYDALVGPAGFKKENVLLLTDKTDKKPTLRNVKWALGTFLGRQALKDDTVLIFFAGHGAPEIDTRGVEKDGFSKYLIPADADPDDLYASAFPMDELQTIFDRIDAQRVVAFLDACYSGAAGGRTFASKKTRAGSINDEFLERQARSKGRVIITASAPNEVSLELPELGHGIFTYYLVEGLKGAADTNHDGIVSLQELYTYVQEQVAKKSRLVGGKQNPMIIRGQQEGDLPLTKVKASK